MYDIKILFARIILNYLQYYNKNTLQVLPASYERNNTFKIIRLHFLFSRTKGETFTTHIDVDHDDKSL